MNKKEIARTIVTCFYQGGTDNKYKWSKLAELLGMPFTEEEIDFGIANVFYNNDKKLTDYQKEQGVGLRLYGLRVFVSYSMQTLKRFPLLDKYEDEVDRIEGNISTFIKMLRENCIPFGSTKPWWKFWA